MSRLPAPNRAPSLPIEAWRTALQQGLADLALPADEAQQAQLLAYLALLAKWNRVHNLTAVRAPADMLTHHLLDSLAVVPHIPPGEGALLDVGSGGGLPGIPIAIMRPELQVTLLDSNTKKAAFLQQAVIELGLAGTRVFGGRAEAYQPEVLPRWIVSRAFAALADFVAVTRHLAHADGRWLAMKGVVPHDELPQLPDDIRVESTFRLQVPGLDAERHLLILSLVPPYKT